MDQATTVEGKQTPEALGDARVTCTCEIGCSYLSLLSAKSIGGFSKQSTNLHYVLQRRLARQRN